ncbi:FxDxF family PEP-CTERM protein [Phenylobacterium sp.]|uniref:FxDxF family PEP-CTERM protein n=1 Tax=Phenylobacterium sp. TaxID=1871053 RepID=UPI001209023F|nr:FxDxF family PEP-CTERM protein [Phenylobacterium sp.]THD55551.1 MAG: PEP-CTERM sorting domain-containing protein [Phenylobacterium sp.]
MKSVVIAATVAAALLAAASQASATQSITFDPPAPDGSFSGMFGDTGLASGAFTDTFTFNMPTGVGGATISSEFTSDQMNNIDFTSVTFNGQQFNIGSTGQVEFRSLVGVPVTNGPQTVVVSGTSGGNGSFAGTLSFALAGATVPEPASWALMMMGFGGAGALIRARRRIVGAANAA